MKVVCQSLAIVFVISSVLMLTCATFLAVVASDAAFEREVQGKMVPDVELSEDLGFVIAASCVMSFAFFLGAFVTGLQGACLISWGFGSFDLPITRNLKGMLDSEMKTVSYFLPQDRPHAT